MTTVGILGGGQLARMLALAGIPRGLTFSVYDPIDAACAADAANHVQGAYDDAEALKAFAESVDVVTYEFENVPVTTANIINEFAPVYPGPKALDMTQDRLREKTFLQGIGINTADFHPVDNLDDLKAAADTMSLPLVLKSRSGGYDGKGQAVIKSEADFESGLAGAGNTNLIAEAWVPFDREISIIAVRSTTGEKATYTIGENVHKNGILQTTVIRPNDPVQTKAEAMVTRLLDELKYVGTIGLELFQVRDQLLANEYAPRVHNTGHWTIEGAQVSQFENHLRAILGWPLGDTRTIAPCTMVNFVGEQPEATRFCDIPNSHYHNYGKEPRAGRKVGHMTVLADDVATVESAAANIISRIQFG